MLFPISPSVPVLVLFTAASLGAVMVVRLGRGQFYPQALAWTHGTIALVGVGLLAYVVLAGAVDPLLDDGALFVVMAASGGAVLAVTGRGGQRPNAWALSSPGFFLLQDQPECHRWVDAYSVLTRRSKRLTITPISPEGCPVETRFRPKSTTNQR